MAHILEKGKAWSSKYLERMPEFALKHPSYFLNSEKNACASLLEKHVSGANYIRSLLENETMDITKLTLGNWNKQPLIYELFKKQRMMNSVEAGENGIDLSKMREGIKYVISLSLSLSNATSFSPLE